jgi:hypothetical protein
MVRHHVLIGLGFKRQNFRSRAIKYLMDKNILGSGMRPAVMSPSLSRPTRGSGETMRPAVEPSYRSAVMPPSYSRPRAPLKFNY